MGCRTSGDCIEKGLKVYRTGYQKGSWNSNLSFSKQKKKIPFEKAFALYQEGKRDNEVAKLFGVSQSYMQKWRARNAIPAAPPGRVYDKEKAIELMGHGLGDTAIGKELHVSVSVIKKLRKSKNIPSAAQIRRELLERIKKSDE